MTDDAMWTKANAIARRAFCTCAAIVPDGRHTISCHGATETVATAIFAALRDVEARTLRSVAIELRCFSWLAVQNYADQLDARAAETETK